jgi:hypothetical protein
MHDAECFALSTNAFDRLLAEYASSDKLKVWQSTYVMDVRSHLLQQAAIVGSLLWHSNKSNLKLSFDNLEVKEYVGETDLKVNVPKFLSHVKNKSQRYDLNDDHLDGGIQVGLKASERIWHLVRGHDLIDLLCFAFRKTLGSCKAQDATRENIQRGLRLAYVEDDFSRTQLFSQIRGWEAAHSPFRVFRPLRQQSLGF